jgi:hypothetical protein
MRTLDFLVAGAARSGTTSLHSYLMQHPQIFLPGIKEPGFFVFEGKHEKYVKGKFAFAIRDFNVYERLFKSAGPSQIIGEMSTPYLYQYQKSIAAIEKYFPDYRKIKIVILLRDPAARAFSQYMWRVRDGREPLNFEEAVNAERKRMVDGYSFDYFYVDRGFYFNQVKAFLENFDDVHIILFEEFKKDPKPVLKELCRFLDVDDQFEFRREQTQNESSAPRSRLLSRWVTTESKMKFKIWYSLPDAARKKIRNLFSKLNGDVRAKIEMDSAMREKLVKVYREDILLLEKLINRDLSLWLK